MFDNAETIDNSMTANQSWKLTALASKERVQAALLAHDEALDWDAEVVLSGCEIDEQKPLEWKLEAWLPHKPVKADEQAINALFDGKPPKLHAEQLPHQDWVTLSQAGTEPIRAGVFYVHTPEHPPCPDRNLVSLSIPASQAFGTGQHETTAGCLSLLCKMKSTGVIARNVADIGTGSGLLAIAARELWPSARLTASDIDPICTSVVEYNAGENDCDMGANLGQLTMVVADGMENPLLSARGPYDLLIANILAGPLIQMADDFAENIADRGHLLLAGLLSEQEDAVRAAYRKAGFRLAQRLVNGNWSILWLRKRA